MFNFLYTHAYAHISLSLTATNYALAMPLHYPAEIPMRADAVQSSPKPASWATCAVGPTNAAVVATAIYPAPAGNPFPAPQGYSAAHPYRQGF